MQHQELRFFNEQLPLVAEFCNCCPIKNSVICTYIHLRKRHNTSYYPSDLERDVSQLFYMQRGRSFNGFVIWPTVIIEAGYTFSFSSNCGTFCILPNAMMEASGTLIRGDPNFPPIAPILLKVILPPDISSELSLLARANCCSRESSIVI